MNTFIIVFCVIAAVFAVGTLFYVGGSAVKQSQEQKNPGVKKKIDSGDPTPVGSCGWLLLGSLVGTASGVLAAYVMANPKERKKKEPTKKP